MGLASTHLVFSTYKNMNVIVGFFSITNKPLILNDKLFNSLSKTLRKKFVNIGYRVPNENGKVTKSDLIVPAYLIGQLGLNYSEEARQTKSITGVQLVALAENKLLEAIQIVNGKYCWLECKDIKGLLNFYVESCKYTLVEDYISSNGLRLLVKKIN